MIRRKYGLKEKHIYKALSQTTEKILVNNLRKVTMKNTVVDGILTEDINWHTLIRLISNRQNSSELIKLPVKVFNSVAFKYL